MRSTIVVIALICLNAVYHVVGTKEAAASSSNDNESDKRGGARMSNWMEKRGGARFQSYGYGDYDADKRAGARYMAMDKRPGGRLMSAEEFHDAVKRPGGRLSAYHFVKRQNDDEEDEPVYALKRGRSGYPSWLRTG